MERLQTLREWAFAYSPHGEIWIEAATREVWVSDPDCEQNYSVGKLPEDVYAVEIPGGVLEYGQDSWYVGHPEQVQRVISSLRDLRNAVRAIRAEVGESMCLPDTFYALTAVRSPAGDPE